MYLLFILIGLILLIGGGVGLFFTNINIVSGSELWVAGNITFGVFTLVGILVLVLLFIYGSEFE